MIWVLILVRLTGGRKGNQWSSGCGRGLRGGGRHMGPSKEEVLQMIWRARYMERMILGNYCRLMSTRFCANWNRGLWHIYISCRLQCVSEDGITSSSHERICKPSRIHYHNNSRTNSVQLLIRSLKIISFSFPVHFCRRFRKITDKPVLVLWSFSTLTEVFLPWLRFFYPDWGFSNLTEVFLPWRRFSYPDWGFNTLTEVFLPRLRFYYPDWGFSVFFSQL